VTECGSNRSERTKVKADAQDYLRRYLDIHEVEADYLLGEHGAIAYLKSTLEEREVDLVLMGSQGGLYSGRFLLAVHWITCCVNQKPRFLSAAD